MPVHRKMNGDVRLFKRGASVAQLQSPSRILQGNITLHKAVQDPCIAGINQSIGAAAGLDTEGDWPAAITKTLARLV